MIKLLVGAALIYALFLLARKFMATPPAMPRAEAARLLGVATDADGETVLEAHRRLISRVHPDAGGNDELAAQINRARDTLLK